VHGKLDVPAVYHPPASFSKAFSSKFRLRRQVGLPAFLPPAYLSDYYVKFKNVASVLERIELFLGARFPFNMLGDQTLLFSRINKEESFTQSNQGHQTTDWRIVTMQSNLPRDHVFCPDEPVTARLVGFVAPIVSIRTIFEDFTHGFSGCHPILDLSRDLPANSRIAYHHHDEQNM
jgi:hypothetical protein